MSEKHLVWLSVGLGVATLVITYRMAKGLESAKADIDSFKANPAKGVLDFFGSYQ